MIRTVLLFIAFFSIGISDACAHEEKPLALNESHKKIVAKIEDYFNGIRSLQSGFVQSSTSGAFAEGTVSILKPNKMRLEYKPPHPVEIVADGKYLIFHDKKLEQVTHMDLKSNPAAFLLEENFRFANSNLTISDISDKQGTIEIAVYKTDEPLNGRVRLIFRRNPFELKQWQITDAQQVKTMVSLTSAQFNVTLDEKLFEFKNPKKNLRPGDKGYNSRR